MRFRRKPVSVFEVGERVALREETVEAEEVPVVGPDWMGACRRYEKAMKSAQEGDWTRALELRDEAREMLA